MVYGVSSSSAGFSGGRGSWRGEAEGLNPAFGAESLWAEAKPPARPLQTMLARF